MSQARRSALAVIFFLLGALGGMSLLTGCATDSQGNKESAGEAIQRMDNSLENTISRLQNKTYDE